ncbi:MAG: LysR family transcriptional regulator [Alphaproteobacteria bacterium]|nr:LysR family transcriptional regulator [Alphaproteobacteria bacterium]
MDPTPIDCFLAVADAGNVTCAARRCGLSQPALSRALLPLERGARGPLFVRRRNDIRLTEAGLRLLASLRRAAPSEPALPVTQPG